MQKKLKIKLVNEDITFDRVVNNHDTLNKNIGDWIWYIDNNKNLVFTNESFKLIYSLFYGKEPIVGQNLTEQGSGDSIISEFDNFYDQALEGKTISIDLNSYIKGEFISTEISFHPIFNGDIVSGVACYSRNPKESLGKDKSINITEEKYKLLFKENPTPMVIYDFDSLKILKANNSAIDNYGYSYEEFLSMTVLDFRMIDENSRMLKWEEELENKNKNTGVFRHKKKNQKLIQVEETAQLIQYNGKKAVLAVMQDISDKKAAEKQIQETNSSLKISDNKFKTVFDSTLDGLSITDEEGYVKEVNPAICRMLGYTREELINMNRRDVLIIDKSELDSVVNIRNTEGNYYGVLKFKHKNGSALDMEVSSTTINDVNGTKLTFTSLRDITEKLEAKSKLEQSEQLYKSLFEKNPDAIFSLDLDGNFISVNEALANLAECTIQELLERTYIPFIEEENMQHILDMFYVAEAGEKISSDVFMFTAKGKKRLINITMLPVIVNNEIVAVYGIMKDITALQKAKNDLLEREIRFKALIENSYDMVTLFNAEGEIEYISPSIRRIFEYKIEDITDKNIFNIIHPDDIPLAKTQFKTVLENPGAPIQSRLRNKVNDEKYIWVEGTVTNMLQVPGVNAIVANFRDITNQRNVEEDLKVSLSQVQAAAERQSAILNSLGAHIALLDHDGIIIEVNDAWKKFADDNFLISNSYAVGDNYIKIAESSKGEDAIMGIQIANAIRDVSSGKISEFHLEYPCHSLFEYRWFRVSITPLYKVRNAGVVVSHFNITDKKQAELKIKQSNERYELVTKATSDAIWDWNLQSDDLYWGDGYEKLFGYGVTQVRGGKETWSNRIFPEDKKRVLDKIQREIKHSDNHFWQDEYRYIKSDGSIAYVYDRGFVIFDEHKMPLRMVGAMQDITERKNSEIEREKITADLLQRNKDLEQFTYIVSHNLRAPMANIMGISNIVLEHKLDQRELSQSISDLDESVKKLDYVINDLNQILQVKNEISKKREIVNFAEIVSMVENSIDSLMKEENVTINTDFSEIDEILVVKMYLYSIFYNLIFNSIRYKQVGVPPIIFIKTIKVMNGIKLIFKDNSMGFDLPKHGDKIFKLYNRFHPMIEGKGMGLFMVKTHVETIGGRISLTSEVNKGTEFIIEFESR